MFITHLPHLEDLTPHRQRLLVTALAEGIKEGTPRFPVTLKWDGVTAVIFGHDAGGFFVSPKGGHRQFRTLADCRAHPFVGRQFGIVWECCVGLPPFAPLGADILFDGPAQGELTCQPNTLIYHFESLPACRLGLAVHTDYEHGMAPLETPAVLGPEIWCAPTVITEIRPWSVWQHNEFTRLRGKAMLGRPQALQALKRLLLSAYLPILENVHVLNGAHEGIVVWAAGGPVKIVDRQGFTKVNRERWER